MSNYLHPTRLESQLSTQGSRPSFGSLSEFTLDFRQLATSGIAFLVAVAIVIDAYWLFTLIAALVTSEEGWTWSSLISRCPLGELVSTPLYIAASLLGIGLTITSQNSNRWLSIGWLAGLVVASIDLSQTLFLNQLMPVPSWGLLTFWFATLCLATIQEKSNWFTIQHVAFFVSIIFCLSLWGQHGNLGILKSFLPNWQGLDVGHPSLPTSIRWQEAMVALIGGFLAVVVIPCVIAAIMFRESPSSFGLTLPSEKRRELWFRSSLLLLAGFPVFYYSSANPELQSHYPYVRDFANPSQLIVFELTTLLFYTCVEFVFRGYVLFGVEKLLRGSDAAGTNRIATIVAIIVSSVPYIIWHLEKPTPELIGALFWAIIAGISAVQYRTVVHLIVIHWLWNVCLDINVLRHLEIGFTG